MKLLTYVTFILFAFNMFYVVEELEQKYRPVPATHKALEPVYHLINSKLYLQEEDHDRGQAELKKAISKIDDLKSKIEDEQTLELFHMLLPDLEKLSESHTLEVEAVNDRYVKMLLALSYLQVRYALDCNDTQSTVDMRLSLRRAMLIVKKALILSEGSKRDHEVNIYARMNDIVKSRIRQPHEIKKTLEQVLTEIKSLEISFDQRAV